MSYTRTNLFIDTAADGQTPCLPTIISQISVDGYIIEDNKGTNVHKQIWTIKGPTYPAEIQWPSRV